MLNAYGWWTVGQYATYAGIGLALAALAVLLAPLLEVYLVVRARETKPQTIRQTQTHSALAH